MSDITIYHNPNCSSSRNALALIRDSGAEPTVVEYLKTPPSRDELLALVQRMGGSVRDVLRQRGTPYDELDLGNSKWTDAQLLDFIAAIERHTGRPAIKELKDIQPGDVPATFADVSELERWTGLHPSTSIDEGVGRFVAWYRGYYRA